MESIKIVGQSKEQSNVENVNIQLNYLPLSVKLNTCLKFTAFRSGNNFFMLPQLRKTVVLLGSGSDKRPLSVPERCLLEEVTAEQSISGSQLWMQARASHLK